MASPYSSIIDIFPLCQLDVASSIRFSCGVHLDWVESALQKNEWEPYNMHGDSSELGRGTSGLVSSVCHVPSQKVFAVKSIDKPTIVSCGITQQVENEIRFQMAANHQNILACYFCIEDNHCIHLFMECCEGDLYNELKLRPTRTFEEREAFIYFAQFINGLQYLHATGYFHRDLKLENLLLSRDRVLKIADFGWIGNVIGHRNNFNFCGTLDYLAPEMIQGLGHDWRVDIWGAGVLLYEMIAGYPPFHSLDSKDLIENILKYKTSFPSGVSAEARDLIQLLLQPMPENRISLSEIVGTPWAIKMWGQLSRPLIDKAIDDKCGDDRKKTGVLFLKYEIIHTGC